MKNWDTDKILGTGLAFALIIFIVGQFVALIAGYKPLPMELGTTIVTGLVGYMGRSLAEKLKKDEPPKDDSKPVDANKNPQAQRPATFDVPKR